GEVCLINDFSLVKACPSNEAYLDEAILDYPLMLRNTRPGDRFMPLGMKCFKKLHDFFIDAKVPRDQRIYVPLLVVGEEIAWVVGYRIDGRFALKQGAREAVHLVTTSTARISGP
ncbi:MAG: tRNA lysidine(34) synthetase TilS, partial [Clostridia bacterium]|nr:tRNA lysidine(34) synthetase TilS [Clostridia bacterium]